MKRPAFQFYPADWRKDPALSACSLAARGLWIELMCIAHESDQYGILTVNGRPMSNAQIARMVGETPRILDRLLTELESAGVFSRNEDGAIFSRRMVKDEALRNVRAEAGKKGGNPSLVGNKDKHLLKQTGKQSPTPSSSSSSSDNSLSPAPDDRLDIPGLTGYHPADWQPDPGQLRAELFRRGVPMPPPDVLALSLDKFNLHFANKPMTQAEAHKRLGIWLAEDRLRDQQRPQASQHAAAGHAQPTRRPQGFEHGDAVGDEWLRSQGVDVPEPTGR